MLRRDGCDFFVFAFFSLGFRLGGQFVYCFCFCVGRSLSLFKIPSVQRGRSPCLFDVLSFAPKSSTRVSVFSLFSSCLDTFTSSLLHFLPFSTLEVFVFLV